MSTFTTRPDGPHELPDDVIGAWASVLLDLYNREQDVERPTAAGDASATPAESSPGGDAA